jgi:hypothetical protein
MHMRPAPFRGMLARDSLWQYSTITYKRCVGLTRVDLHSCGENARQVDVVKSVGVGQGRVVRVVHLAKVGLVLIHILEADDASRPFERPTDAVARRYSKIGVNCILKKIKESRCCPLQVNNV